MTRARRISLMIAPLLLTATCSDPEETGPGPNDGRCTFGDPKEEIPVPPIHTPRWAFEPWISKDISTGADTYEFVKGFRDRDIPVGAVVLDSPWETSYNTFIPNPDRYPEFNKMVADLHADNVRIVLWITPLVNATSFDLEIGGDVYGGPAPRQEEGLACGFFVNSGEQYVWWKGLGAAVDFFNPQATAWWHEQQNTVLDAGIDGWKLDFGESYVETDPVMTAAGPVPHQEYSEAYYRDFWSYGVHRRGKEFVTMVRAYDKSYNFEGRFFARPEHAPVAWMGDNRRDWIGFADALDHMLVSAKAGYAVVGSDIGGYLDRNDEDLTDPEIPFDNAVFARWTGTSALTPFMQLHGRANITPWTVPQTGDEVVNVYRYWSKIHSEVVPLFYSLAEEAYAGGENILRPVTDEAGWPGDYRFLVGDALLVAPILDASGKRDVALPAGADWYDWWAPEADATAGGKTVAGYDATDLLRVPLFIRKGAIMPASVKDSETGLGTAASAGKLTLIVYPAEAKTSFRLHDEDDAVTTIEASRAADRATITMSRALRDTVLRVRADTPAASVEVDGVPVPELATREAFDAAASGWLLDTALRAVWVKAPKGANARSVEIIEAP